MRRVDSATTRRDLLPERSLLASFSGSTLHALASLSSPLPVFLAPHRLCGYRGRLEGSRRTLARPQGRVNGCGRTLVPHTGRRLGRPLPYLLADRPHAQGTQAYACTLVTYVLLPSASQVPPSTGWLIPPLVRTCILLGSLAHAVVAMRSRVEPLLSSEGTVSRRRLAGDRGGSVSRCRPADKENTPLCSRIGQASQVRAWLGHPYFASAAPPANP